MILYLLSQSKTNFALTMGASTVDRCNLDKLPKSVEEISVVEIEGLDSCACAGTHVKNTSEIGD